MKRLSLLPIVVLVAGAVACGGSRPLPASPSNASSASDDGQGAARLGATSAQGSDNPNRPMTRPECDELGEYIAGVCHATHTRQARIEGWCSDKLSQISGSSWADECTKNLKYMDAVCFRSTDNAPAMMICDRTAGE